MPTKLTFVALLCGWLLVATPAYQLPVDQELKTQYHVTRLAANGLVLQAGAVLVVQQGNIKASPASAQLYYPNSYAKDGRVKQSFKQSLRAEMSLRAMKDQARTINIGEKAYVIDIEARKSDLVFKIQTCGTCNPSAQDPNDIPYRSEIIFQFQKGLADSASVQDIQATIGQLFAIAPSDEKETSEQTATTSASAPVDSQQFQPIAPPPAPRPDPTRIEAGQTIDDVRASLGQPEKIVSLGSKVIFVYKDMKITFIDGRVSDVE